jgi:hypothetical protein
MLSSRSVLIRLAAGLALVAIPLTAAGAPASAKGTPSRLKVTCGPGVVSATVTFQLMSGVSNPAPASGQFVENCASTAGGRERISPLTQPASAYSWSVFATSSTSGTFGCGGVASRGTAAVCTNTAGGSAQVTVLAT